jgi:hypothetical protein
MLRPGHMLNAGLGERPGLGLHVRATNRAAQAVAVAVLTRISTQEVEGNLSAVNASGIARLTCGNRNRW